MLHLCPNVSSSDDLYLAGDYSNTNLDVSQFQITVARCDN